MRSNRKTVSTLKHRRGRTFRHPKGRGLRQKETRLLVEALRPLGEGLHSLLHLLPVALLEHCAEDLLDPHRHLPADPLLLLGGSAEFMSLGHCPAQGLRILPALEPLHRFALDLTDSLPRNVQFVRELGKRGRLEAFQAIPAY